MNKLSVTGIINSYHCFDREFWLSYKSLEKVMDKSRFEEIKMNILRSKRIDPKYFNEIDKAAYDIELQLLDAQWKSESDEAKQNGINIHEKIHDLFYTNLQELKKDFNIDTDLYQVQQTEAFLNADKGLFPEFKLTTTLDDDIILNGVADLIIKDGNKITIIDWKSDDSITFKAHFDVAKKQSKALRYPLNKLADANGVHYQLQLSIYAWMLQQLNPDLEIQDLKIIQIKDMKKSKEFPVTYLKKEVETLIKWHVKSIKLQEEVQKCRPLEF